MFLIMLSVFLNIVLITEKAATPAPILAHAEVMETGIIEKGNKVTHYQKPVTRYFYCHRKPSKVSRGMFSHLRNKKLENVGIISRVD